MKVLFLGFCGIIKDYDIVVHVDAIRVKEYFTLFRSHYQNVNYFSVDKDGWIYGESDKIHLDDALLKNYDLIFMYHEVTMDRLISNYGKSEVIKFISATPSFIQLDCSIWPLTKDNAIMSNFDAIGIAHPFSYLEISHRDKHMIPNATISRKKPVNINKDGDLLYIGRVAQNVRKIRKFSQQIKKTIRLYTFDENDGALFNSDEYIKYAGALKYNSLHLGMENISYGLCFFDNQSPCGKIFDYISYGLPVLAEDLVGESKIIKDDNMGALFDIHKLHEFKLPDPYFVSTDIYDTVQEKHLWEHRTNKWFEIINNYIKWEY